MEDKQDEGAGQIISEPHPHDVLSGRGGLTNQHPGNEWFRRLVRSNRALYRSCPKHTKLLVAKAIVQAVQQQDPAGRFLEIADKNAGTWRQITYKRAVDKTSQALREKDQPTNNKSDGINSEAVKAAAVAGARKGKRKGGGDLSDLTKATLKQAGLDTGKVSDRNQQQLPNKATNSNMRQGDTKRKAPSHGTSGSSGFVKPSWWNRGAPIMGSSEGSPNKRIKTDDDPAPLPTAPLEVRQSSLFRFLNNSGIFGRGNAPPPAQSQPSGMFAFSAGSNSMSQNPGDMISNEAAAFIPQNLNDDNGNSRLSFVMQQRASLGRVGGNNGFDPMTVSMNGINQPHQRNGFAFQQQQMLGQMQQQQQQRNCGMFAGNLNNNMGIREKGSDQLLEEMPTTGLFPDGTDGSRGFNEDAAVPPPTNSLTMQVSDWLTSFWPLGKEENQATPPPPSPPQQDLQRSISSTLFNLARSPSQFLTNLKSGVTSMFGGDDSSLNPSAVFPPGVMGDQQSATVLPPNPMAVGGNGVGMMGTAHAKRESLLDDYEESALESRLRSVPTRR